MQTTTVSLRVNSNHAKPDAMPFSSSGSARIKTTDVEAETVGVPMQKPNLFADDENSPSGTKLKQDIVLPRPPAAAGTFLRIISINDVYKLDNYSRLAAAVHAARDKASKLDCKVVCALNGDFIMPCTLTALDGGRAMVEGLNAAGVDFVCEPLHAEHTHTLPCALHNLATALRSHLRTGSSPLCTGLGNHEFDVGEANFAARMRAFRGKVLNSNCDREAFKEMPKYEILRVGTRTVLMGGFVTADASSYRPSAFPDPSHVPQACIDLWEDVKAREAVTPDAFVPLTHQSVADDHATIDLLAGHAELKSRMPAVLGGHDHEVHLEEHEGSFVVKVGQDAENIGFVDIFWTAKGAVQTSVALLPATCFTPEPTAEAFVQRKHGMLEEMMKLPLTDLPAPMSTKRVRFEASAMASFLLGSVKRGLCADAVEIALLQGGCFRGNCDYDAGSFSLGDLYKELKFEIPMALVSLPGWVIEDSVRNTRSATKPAAQLLNLDDACVVSPEHRVISVDSQPFSRDRMYKVAIYQYLLTGLDGIEPLMSYVKAHVSVPDEETCLPVKQLIVSACMKDTWRNLLGLQEVSDPPVSPVGTQAAPLCELEATPSSLRASSMAKPEHATQLVTPMLVRDKLRSAFDEVDQGDGMIDSRDLRAYLQARSSCPGTLLIKRMIEALDNDGDSRISRLDFSTLYQRKGQVLPECSSTAATSQSGLVTPIPTAGSIASASPVVARTETVVYIEGGIGVGKSTLLAALQEAFYKDPRVVLLPEPVEQWRQAGWLQAMYEGSMSKLEFQTNVLGTMIDPISSALAIPGVELVIVERSPLSCRAVFAAVNLSDVELCAFDHEYEKQMRAAPRIGREVTVLLHSDIETLLERIASRGRPEEQSIPESYHAALREKHQELFSAVTHDKYEVDASQGKDAVVIEMQRIISRYLPVETSLIEQVGGARRKALDDQSNAQDPAGVDVASPKPFKRKGFVDGPVDAYSPLRTR